MTTGEYLNVPLFDEEDISLRMVEIKDSHRCDGEIAIQLKLEQEGNEVVFAFTKSGLRCIMAYVARNRDVLLK